MKHLKMFENYFSEERIKRNAEISKSDDDCIIIDIDEMFEQYVGHKRKELANKMDRAGIIINKDKDLIHKIMEYEKKLDELCKDKLVSQFTLTTEIKKVVMFVTVNENPEFEISLNYYEPPLDKIIQLPKIKIWSGEYKARWEKNRTAMRFDL